MPCLCVQDGDVAAVQVVAIEAVFRMGRVSGIVVLNETSVGPPEPNTYARQDKSKKRGGGG